VAFSPPPLRRGDSSNGDDAVGPNSPGSAALHHGEPAASPRPSLEDSRDSKFADVLSQPHVDLGNAPLAASITPHADSGAYCSDTVKKLSWTGIPVQCRPMAWQLLLVGVLCPAVPSRRLTAFAQGYLPCNSDRREATLVRKRKEYADAVSQYFHKSESERTQEEGEILRQV
jgi:hypothetical protein